MVEHGNDERRAREHPRRAPAQREGPLVAGGANNNGANTLASSELFDPVSGSWSLTGSLATARLYHTLTVLPTGKALAAGGYGAGLVSLATCELFDPAAGTWAATGSMATARTSQTATLLPSGKVPAAAGYNSGGNVSLATAELFDPAAGSWTPTGSLTGIRYGHTAALLATGKVLIEGGNNNSSGDVATAELYDPNLGTWSGTGALNVAREQHTSTVLPNGKVLVSAGTTNSGTTASAELYDPSAATWSLTGSLSSARRYHSATLLPNGKVLVAGGYTNNVGTLPTSVIYDSAAASWVTGPSLNTPRNQHTAVLLPSARVLVAGGQNETGQLASAELALYTEHDYRQSSSAQPAVTAINGQQIFPVTVTTGSLVAVSGSSLTGVSQGSSGYYDSDAAANLPRVYLRSFDGGSYWGSSAQLIDVTTSVYANPLSAGALSFTVPSSLAPGDYLFWVQSNAVPSDAKILRVLSPTASYGVGARLGLSGQRRGLHAQPAPQGLVPGPCLGHHQRRPDRDPRRFSPNFDVSVSTTFQYSLAAAGWSGLPASPGGTVFYTPQQDLGGCNTTTFYLRSDPLRRPLERLVRQPQRPRPRRLGLDERIPSRPTRRSSAPSRPAQ